MGKALIIGAGPAGTGAALALDRVGWDVEVAEAYERSAGLGQGSFMTVAMNGFDALAAFGAEGRVRELGFETTGIRLAGSSGRELGRVPLGPPGSDGRSARTLLRADLYSALLDECDARGIPVHYGRRLVEVEERPDRVVASFADGESEEADLLLGADGLWSSVRGALDPDAVPRYAGIGNFGGIAPAGSVELPAVDAEGEYRMVWGRETFFGYAVSPTGEVWWFANPPRREALSGAELARPEELRKELIGRLEEDSGPAAAIVGASTDALLFGNLYDLAPPRNWTSRRIALVGDAAHAVSPSTGQGVSLAWEDAAVLAGLLARRENVAPALAEYERLRRPRVERVRKMGRRSSQTKKASPLGARLRDALMPLALRAMSHPRAIARQAWLHEHHVEQLPSPSEERAPAQPFAA